MTLTDENRPFIRMLLPFWVNGTLRGYDATIVQSAIATDASLRAEVEALKALRSGMKALPAEPSPGEFGLARLQRAIAAEQPARRRSVFPAAAAAAVLAAVVGAYMAIPGFRSPDASFRQAAGPSGSALVVGFRDGTTEADLTQALLSHDLVIVDGPSANGLYRVQSLVDADPGQLQAALKAEASVFETVEQAE